MLLHMLYYYSNSHAFFCAGLSLVVGVYRTARVFALAMGHSDAAAVGTYFTDPHNS